MATAAVHTPHRVALEAKSGDLRTILKEFERTFALAHGGRKPSKVDIRNDKLIAGKYKEFNQIKAALSAANLVSKNIEDGGQQGSETQPKHGTISRQEASHASLLDHQEAASGLSTEPQQTPRKQKTRPIQHKVSTPVVDRSILDTIGPTPHRDGAVLGIFDKVGASSREAPACNLKTPCTISRKRKLQEVYSETPRGVLRPLLSASCILDEESAASSAKIEADVGHFDVEITPQKRSQDNILADIGRSSRTPRSESQKFRYSQFVVTPTLRRFASPEGGGVRNTDIEPDVTSKSSAVHFSPPGYDDRLADRVATPTCLRRSTSFKEKLLASSSRSSSFMEKSGGASAGEKPNIQRLFRSSTSNTFQHYGSSDTLPTLFPGDVENEADELEALRDAEKDCTGHVTVKDRHRMQPYELLNSGDEAVRSPKHKKKGQKRTTKRSVIRIAETVENKRRDNIFVSGEASEDYNEEYGEQVPVSEDCELIEETQLWSNGSFDNSRDTEVYLATKTYDGRAAGKQNPADIHAEPRKGASGQHKKTLAREKPGMINPNAQSHQNFRSLKINRAVSTVRSIGRKFSKRR